MRKLAAVLLMVSASGLVLGGVTVAGAAAPGKKKPPVKIEGDVTNKGVGKVDSSNEVELEADDFYFKKTFIKGKPGQTVQVTIENEGNTDHTFTIDSEDVDEEISPDDSANVSVTIPDDGTPVVFYCRFHQASGMQGAFFSKKGSTGSARGGGSGNTTPTTASSGSSGGYGY